MHSLQRLIETKENFTFDQETGELHFGPWFVGTINDIGDFPCLSEDDHEEFTADRATIIKLLTSSLKIYLAFSKLYDMLDGRHYLPGVDAISEFDKDEQKQLKGWMSEYTHILNRFEYCDPLGGDNPCDYTLGVVKPEVRDLFRPYNQIIDGVRDAWDFIKEIEGVDGFYDRTSKQELKDEQGSDEKD